MRWRWGGNYDVVERQQRMVDGERLGFRNIQCCKADLLISQSFIQCRIIHDWAPGRVYENTGLFHLLELLPAYQMVGFRGEICVDRDEVRFAK